MKDWSAESVGEANYRKERLTEIVRSSEYIIYPVNASILTVI